MMIAVLADVHMQRARAGWRRAIELIGDAEAVIHAGDFLGASALAEIRTLCPAMHPVHGHVEEQALRASLPATRYLEFGVLAVIHDPAQARLDCSPAPPLPDRRRRRLRLRPYAAPRGAGRFSNLQPR